MYTCFYILYIIIYKIVDMGLIYTYRMYTVCVRMWTDWGLVSLFPLSYRGYGVSTLASIDVYDSHIRLHSAPGQMGDACIRIEVLPER